MRPMWISPLAVLALVALLFVTIRLLVDPRTRHWVIGLGVLVAVGAVFLGFFSFREVRVQQQARMWAEEQQSQQEEVAAHRHETQMIGQKLRMQTIAPPAAPSPPTIAPAEINQPKMTAAAALRQAIIQAWTGRAPAPVAETRPKPEKADKPKALESDVRTLDQPPDWVNAPAKLEGSDYVTTVRTDPYTTPMECEQHLPEALQNVLKEYADVSLGPQAAAIRFSDDDLKQFIRRRWTEVRSMEMESGATRNMYTLHAQVVFDHRAQQLITSAAERALIDKRVQGGAALLGGLLTFLAGTWGGLKLATKRS
jgi:hypothetical protein